MDNLVRFRCPYCNQSLKAPPEFAGRRVKCTRSSCLQPLLVPTLVGEEPLETAPLPSFMPPPVPSSRTATKRPVKQQRLPKPVLLLGGGMALFVVVVLFGGAGYWWFGQPSAKQVAAYESYLRTGTELLELHGPMEQPSTATSIATLEAKAEELRQVREQIDGFTGRAKKKLDERYQQPLHDMHLNLTKLTLCNKPYVVTILREDKGSWGVVKMGSFGDRIENMLAKQPNRPAVPATTIPALPLPKPPVVEVPKKETIAWEDVPDDRGSTRAAVVDAPGGISAFGGSVAITLTDVGNGKAPQGQVNLDAPNSFWAVGRGGVTWQGQHYPEGSIVRIDAQRKLHRSTGDHTAWIDLKEEMPIYAKPDATLRPLIVVSVKEQVQLLMAEPETTGFHKVRFGAHEGWAKGDNWKRLVFKQRVGAKVSTPPPPMPTPKPVDLAALSKKIAGKWINGGITLIIESNGQGSVSRITTDGTIYNFSGARFTIELVDQQPRIKYRLTTQTRTEDFELAILDETTSEELVVREVNNRLTPNPRRFQRDTAKEDEPKTPPKKAAEAKSPLNTVAEPGQPRFSDLTVTRTTADPPSVEFTIKFDAQGGKLLEAWSSVGINNPGPVLKDFAGALYQGLLGVNGIDFANPDPSLKAQRVSMKKSAKGDNLYECTVRFPKVVLNDPETDFAIVAAVDKDGKVLKSNVAGVRLNLKTGAIRP